MASQKPVTANYQAPTSRARYYGPFTKPFEHTSVYPTSTVMPPQVYFHHATTHIWRILVT